MDLIPSQLFRSFENLRDQAKDAILAVSSCLCQQQPKLKINGRTCQNHLNSLA
jgi:serine/threonine kinase 16